jgi:hypothetical protein
MTNEQREPKHIPAWLYTQPKFIFVVSEADRQALDKFCARVESWVVGAAELGPGEFLYIHTTKETE